MADDRIGRRALMGGAVGMASLAALPALAQDGTTEFQAPVSGSVRNNVSSFQMPQWQDYFENTRGGAILADTKSRALHYWSEDQSIYRLYPSSVPLSEELTRLGRTEIVRKAVNPPWRPTASMLERNPDWPKMVEGGAKDNPLGFTIKTAIVPTIKLPDYKKIAKAENKNKEEAVVTDEEVEKSLVELQKKAEEILPFLL